MFGFGRKKLSFKDYIFSALGRSRFHYNRTDELVNSVEESLKSVLESRRERDFDEILRRSELKERLEKVEGLDGDDFDDLVEKFKRDNRIR